MRYDGKARLLSPVIRGPKSMRFHYHMYGAHIDRLDVYKRTSKGEEKLWSHFGNHGNEWIEGCVQVPDNETFRVCTKSVHLSVLKSRADLANPANNIIHFHALTQ